MADWLTEEIRKRIGDGRLPQPVLTIFGCWCRAPDIHTLASEVLAQWPKWQARAQRLEASAKWLHRLAEWCTAHFLATMAGGGE